ncbi:Inner membrane protein YjdF [Escherichia coli]|nr:DUF2238 domain-containing protein [Escherichia coli]VCV64724.1 Inner membrane protein YjdF [Escherichia coli]
MRELHCNLFGPAHGSMLPVIPGHLFAIVISRLLVNSRIFLTCELTMTRTLPLILNTGALALTLILIYTGISAHDKLTWLMEVTPVIIVVPLLLATAKRYPLTPLLYTLIFFHAIILMVGGQYTYAKVPIGFEVQEWLGLSRNPYDKLGHFFQGLVPALVAREILVRGMYVRGRKMVAFLVCCVALAISAMYELIEWWAALAMGGERMISRHRATSGTQSDMFCALWRINDGDIPRSLSLPPATALWLDNRITTCALLMPDAA